MNLHKSCQASALPSTRIDDDDDDFSFRNQAVRAPARARDFCSQNISVPEEE
jgi:hypothetical protein